MSADEIDPLRRAIGALMVDISETGEPWPDESIEGLTEAVQYVRRHLATSEREAAASALEDWAETLDGLVDAGPAAATRRQAQRIRSQK